MISKVLVNKQKEATFNADSLFVLAELLIKVDKREKVIESIQSEKDVNEDKRNSNNTNQAK